MEKRKGAAGAESRPPITDNYIFQYYDAIRRIKRGEKIAGVRAAGQFIHDIFRILTDGIKSGEYIFDRKKAGKAIRFIENFCHHSEGRADLLKLELWQKAVVSAIFGIMDPDRPDCRMFREVLLIVARKNGKTLLAAAIMAYMAYIDGEYGAKLYCLAPKLDQAELCFDAFYQIVQSDDELNKITKKRRTDIYIQDFNTSVKKIAFNSKKSDGFNVYFCLNDEIEAWRGDSGLKQYEVISSATGSRAQPLIMSTGTAGYENEGIYDELIRRATAFLKGRKIGKEKERRILPFLFIIDNVEKWDTREEIEKSNPNLDVSVSWEYYREQIAIAHSSLSKKAEFLTKFCNIKQNSSVAWLDFQDVEKAAAKDADGITASLSLDDFRGCYCVGGIDLSRTTDLTAAAVVIERDGINYCIVQFFMPQERYKQAIDEEGVPYNIFREQGFLTISGENVVDYHDVFKWFFNLVKVYKIKPLKVGYDRYSAQYLVQDMKDAGFHMDDVYQGTNLTPILIEFEGKLKDGRIVFGDNGLLQSHFLNVAVDISLKDSRMKPVKIDRRSHIDGSVAVFDAFTVKMKYYNEIGRLLENRGK
ncbi:terminase large subunit [Lachnoclostridium sp. An196]|uniref:terminase large subunit n=1 Tax=Lachnoclostridium sp. An196 TaxID=1965583 RepID=UPI001FA8FB6C|nr:terminase TerL endonuclease subunit [Lachnoclostridium sp. An196]